MRYVSTRGQVPPTGFIDAILMGMADDGGLLVPEHIPQLPEETLKQWKNLSYTDLALEVLSIFVDNEIPREDLKKLIDGSYASFRHHSVTPVRRLDDDKYLLELFYGPTFAFKDVALQFLGNLYAYVASRTNSLIHILGATSGDTGASAIEGVRGKEGIRICILYPHEKVSTVQELQMTTVDDANVLTLAVDGTFDDCQRIIKELFADVSFKHEYHLRAVNSINIARILAQSVYYFYAYFQLVKDGHTGKVNFSVPTGNFGDIFAGYIAKKMGLPIDKLILATNENDILARFVREGVYQPSAFHKTYSPSMDIQIASNFERYLYYLYGKDTEMVTSLMAAFSKEGQITISNREVLSRVQSDFSAYSVSNEECLKTIRGYHQKYEYLLDPHTACGAAATEKTTPAGEKTVILSTAHPAKFDEAIRMTDIQQTYPSEIAALFDKPTTKTLVGGTNAAVKQKLVAFLQ